MRHWGDSNWKIDFISSIAFDDALSMFALVPVDGFEHFGHEEKVRSLSLSVYFKVLSPISLSSKCSVSELRWKWPVWSLLFQAFNFNCLPCLYRELRSRVPLLDTCHSDAYAPCLTGPFGSTTATGHPSLSLIDLLSGANWITVFFDTAFGPSLGDEMRMLERRSVRWFAPVDECKGLARLTVVMPFPHYQFGHFYFLLFVRC